MSRACPLPRSGEFAKAVMVGGIWELRSECDCPKDEQARRIPTGRGFVRALTLWRFDPLRQVALDRYTAHLSRMVSPWDTNWKARLLPSPEPRPASDWRARRRCWPPARAW